MSQMHIERDGTDLVLSRHFNADRQRVWDAWTRPEQLEQWWGCARTTNVNATMDVRVGGSFQHVMTIEGVGDFPMGGFYDEVDPPARLVYTTVTPEEMRPMMPEGARPEMRTTVEFIEEDGGTRIRLTIHDQDSDFMVDQVSQGFTAAFEKLTTLLGASDTASA